MSFFPARTPLPRILLLTAALAMPWGPPVWAVQGAPVAAAAPAVAGVFEAKDTVAPPAGKTPEAAAALKTVHWQPAVFQVTRAAAKEEAYFDAVVSFPSPLPSGQTKRDTVVMHWHRALGKDGKPLAGRAPAAIVLSPLSPDLLDTSDQMAARLAARGIHAFAFALPGAGPRHADAQPMELLEVAAHPEQAVADLRRARDAVAALPEVNGKIGLEAMCFGGLAAIPAQAIDNAFDGVVVGFVGGDINSFFGTFQGMAFRLAFMQSGWTEAQLNALALRTDPGRVASRVDAKKFHFYSFDNDCMWPKVCTDKLLKDLNLPAASRTEFNGTHALMFSKLGKLESRLRKMLREPAKETTQNATQETTQKPIQKPIPSPDLLDAKKAGVPAGLH